MKKKVHVISHSHWDREWYISLEEHRIHLVQLMDDVLDLFENDQDFKYFHLDGQTIILDDYLEIRPEKEELLRKYIQNGQLRVGPYYILQDAFLISGESNVRNSLIGRYETERWGAPQVEPIGYFPDTFGILGQTPQLVKDSDLNYAAYGRGVKPTGFNNQTADNAAFESSFSEMTWRGADKSEILGVLFANWYSNGNEIPVEREAAQAFWQQKLSDVERYASTDQLLMMNGVDHQPVQKDLSEALKIANELFPDYEFVHSNFSEYFEALPKDLEHSLSTVSGELRSQDTDGWYTLANTASSRIYLKQYSIYLSNYLEQVLEPLAVMASELGYTYPHDFINHAWKLLLQNYPHDSICGCSVDEVHRAMMGRFEVVENLCKSLEKEIAAFLVTNRLETPELPEGAVTQVQVWNTTSYPKSDTVTVKAEIDRAYFRDQYPQAAYQTVADKPFGAWKLVDADGNDVPAVIEDAGTSFDYDLPKDAFRVPFMARYVHITATFLEVAPLSGQSFYLVPGDVANEEVEVLTDYESNTIENDRLKITINQLGTVDIFDKKQGYLFENQLIIEETGDIGNEYIFRESQDLTRDYSINKLQHMRVERFDHVQRLVLDYEFELPESADDLLTYEQQSVVDIAHRQSQRSHVLKTQTVTMVLSLTDYQDGLDVELSGNNEVKDHRFRILAVLPEESTHNFADSSYEWVTRSNKVSEFWENPANPQVLRHNVAIANEKDGVPFGLTLSTDGLHEYEVSIEEERHFGATEVAVTFLRATGEMGDWGYFPTPEAQCLGEYSARLYVQPWSGEAERNETFRRGMTHFVGLKAYANRQSKQQWLADTVNASVELGAKLNVSSWPTELVMTAVKRHHYSDDTVIRLWNAGEESLDLSQWISADLVKEELNLVEFSKEASDWTQLESNQIRTLRLN
ncbi:alpha-mannosidase [Fundicoccus culcitae]|uniref:Alpha-mannosidase n=1 Tax=Fundicoccus culcitae TaxID=2969821 RepID=A0ABY5P8G1_9LACT|nr:alpha-mannosidase [Fundicoccus culcitae]UUX35031.1 alpha-mannosidase [Fundicoccus culcitae]